MSCSSFFSSVLNSSRSDHITAIFESHMAHNTSVGNDGRCLALNVSKYEQNRSRFKEIMAVEIRVPPPKDKFWMLLSMLKVKQIYLLQSIQTTDDQV